MKSAIKKISVLVIIFTLLFPLICGLHVQATGDGTASLPWDISENGDGSVTAVLSDNDKTLTISGIGAMKNGNLPWKEKRDTIQKVIINNGVTSIGDSAFYSCTSLTSVTIPESVTSIGEEAFSSCHELTSVTIPENVTSIGKKVFEYCRSLTSVTIPESVTSIGDSAFYWCTSLTSVNVNNNNQNYSSENGILFNKDKTQIITYPAGKTEKIYNIPTSVTIIGRDAFDGCENLTSVTIPNSVTSIGEGAFACSSLTSVTIPKSVTSIGSGAFNLCTSLTSITIPESVTSIGDYAFRWCENLTSVTIPESVTSIGDEAFIRCTSLTSVNVNNNNQNYSSENGILFNKDKTQIITYPAGKTEKMYDIPTSVTIIERGAFYYCENLTSVTIPNSVTSIGGDAFVICTSLTSVTIPDSVTTIERYAFYYCSSLTSVTIPNSVTSIGGDAFRNCTSLTSVAIPNSVTSIESYAFESCESLTNVTIPESVTSIGYKAFYGCTNLTIECNEGSTAHLYAEKNNIKYKLIKSQVNLDISSAKICVDVSIGIRASLTGNENIKDVITWISNNEKVATVNEDGRVTGIAEGEAIITAKVKPEYKSKYEDNSATIIVEKSSDNPSKPKNPSNSNGNNSGGASSINGGSGVGSNGSSSSTSSKESFVGSKDSTLVNAKVLPKAGNHLSKIMILLAMMIATGFAIICYKKSKI